MLRKGLIECFRFGPGPFAGRLAVGGGLRAWTGGGACCRRRTVAVSTVPVVMLALTIFRLAHGTPWIHFRPWTRAVHRAGEDVGAEGRRA